MSSDMSERVAVVSQLRAIDQFASAKEVASMVTHIVYSHHHADHFGASSLFGKDMVRITRPRPRSCWPAKRTVRPFVILESVRLDLWGDSQVHA